MSETAQEAGHSLMGKAIDPALKMTSSGGSVSMDAMLGMGISTAYQYLRQMPYAILR